MSTLVTVVCRECKGASASHDNPPCGWCHSQGHECIDRTHDGKVPTHFGTGEPVTEWVPLLLPDPPRTVWTLTHPRCAP